MSKGTLTRIDVYETLCPQQMLVHKGGKIKNWSGECRDVTPTKLQSQNILKESTGGGGGGGGGRVGGGGQDGCEQRIELKFFVKIQKKNWGGGGGFEGVEGGGGVKLRGGQGGCDRRIEVFGKIQKKKIGGGGVGLVGGGGVKVDVNEKLKFL